jgi:ureidoglycolate lyase
LLRLSLQPLSAAAFQPFGAVIDGDRACERLLINDGRTERLHALAPVDCDAAGGSPAISLFRARPVDAGFVLRRMERHPLGSQAFINLSGNPYAVVVAPPGEFDESAIRGFLARPDQGVSYSRGVWHHYLLALGGPSDFAVIDRIGPGDNCEEVALQAPLCLALPR